MSKHRHHHPKKKSTKVSQVSHTDKVEFAARSLRANLMSLKESLTGLTFHHTKQLTDQLIEELASGFEKLTRRAIAANEWALARLREHQAAHADKHELERQIRMMEGEGNMPGAFSA